MRLATWIRIPGDVAIRTFESSSANGLFGVLNKMAQNTVPDLKRKGKKEGNGACIKNLQEDM